MLTIWSSLVFFIQRSTHVFHSAEDGEVKPEGSLSLPESTLGGKKEDLSSHAG